MRLSVSPCLAVLLSLALSVVASPVEPAPVDSSQSPPTSLVPTHATVPQFQTLPRVFTQGSAQAHSQAPPKTSAPSLGLVPDIDRSPAVKPVAPAVPLPPIISQRGPLQPLPKIAAEPAKTKPLAPLINAVKPLTATTSASATIPSPSPSSPSPSPSSATLAVSSSTDKEFTAISEKTSPESAVESHSTAVKNELPAGSTMTNTAAAAATATATAAVTNADPATDSINSVPVQPQSVWSYSFVAKRDRFNMPLTGKEFTIYRSDGVEALRLETSIRYGHTVTLKAADKARRIPLIGKFHSSSAASDNLGIAKSNYARGIWLFSSNIEFIRNDETAERETAHIKRNANSVLAFGKSWTLTITRPGVPAQQFIVIRRPFFQGIRIFKKSQYRPDYMWTPSGDKAVMVAHRTNRLIRLPPFGKMKWIIKGKSEYIPSSLALLVFGIVERKAGL